MLDNKKTEILQQTSLTNKPVIEMIVDLFIKMVQYKDYLWQNRWKLAIFNILVLSVAIFYFLFISKPYFKSTITILPSYGNKASEMLSQVSGLAAMAGIDVGKTDPTQIYQNIISSETIIKHAVYHEYKTIKFSRPVNLIKYFDLNPDSNIDPQLQEREMFLELYKNFTKKWMTVDVDRITKILTITLEMPESKLSADVINVIARALNDYITEQRQTFASIQRKYLESRILSVKDTLNYYEDKLKAFREKNRLIIQSPELLLEQTRLMRNVEIHQSVYGELLKQAEITKLEEAKNTPIVNIKEYASEPIKKAGPQISFYLISIFIMSIFVSIVISLIWLNLKLTLSKRNS